MAEAELQSRSFDVSRVHLAQFGSKFVMKKKDACKHLLNPEEAESGPGKTLLLIVCVQFGSLLENTVGGTYIYSLEAEQVHTQKYHNLPPKTESRRGEENLLCTAWSQSYY